MCSMLLGSLLVGQADLAELAELAELHVEPAREFSLLAPLVVGLLFVSLVGLVVWCCIKPAVARVCARVFSVLALGFGAGFLTWGICAAALDGSLRSPFGSFMTEPSEAIGCGAGLLAGGIAALVLSFVGGKKESSGGGKKEHRSIKC